MLFLPRRLPQVSLKRGCKFLLPPVMSRIVLLMRAVPGHPPLLVQQRFWHMFGTVRDAAVGRAAFQCPPELDVEMFFNEARFEGEAEDDLFGLDGFF